MLHSLRIENFAIVSQLELDFSKGMTAFTGETGAGKSIMIDALMLALGERADASVIRKGAEKCDISACFHVDQPSSPAEWLDEHDVALDEGEVYLRRVIYAEGRSKSYVNGQPFPLQKIKELSLMLVDIHGQHQHQTLLQHSTHREQLDRYANHQALLTEVHRHYQECQRLKRQCDDLLQKQSMQDHAKILAFQIQELEQLSVKEGEMSFLHEEHQLLHHACDYLEQTQQMTELLNGDEGPSICQGLHHILQLLSSFPAEQANIKNTLELMNNALIQSEEALAELSKFASQVQLDPERLQVVEERIGLLHRTARKYHVEVNQLPQFLLDLQQSLQAFEDSDKQLLELQTRHQQAFAYYQQKAMALRASRQQHAAKLANEITASIQQLGMPKGLVQIEITPLDTMQIHGMDKIEYKVCTNPGMAIDSLAKVASGGELSRIGLAIHVITAQRGSTPTLLFDEVDVGIGGATAALVGQQLRQLGERLQVFCVTHQPQVAACAHHHFMVEKQSDNEQTFSRVVPLTNNDKVEEIARMLGGLTITDQTLLHAKELLEDSAACC